MYMRKVNGRVLKYTGHNLGVDMWVDCGSSTVYQQWLCAQRDDDEFLPTAITNPTAPRTAESSYNVDWSKAPIEATHALRYVDGDIAFAVLVGNRYQTVDRLCDYFIVADKQWQVIEARPVTDEIDDTVTQRGERYGLFADGAVIMQDLKTVMRATPGWERLTPSQREALEMIQHKIGRVLNGDPTYDDSWRDIAGYATLILNELNGVKR